MSVLFYIPTKIIGGENCVRENSLLFSDLGKKALIVTGKTSAVLSGALEDVTKALDERCIKYTVFNEIENNPTVSTVYRGKKAAIDFSADFIIGIGGGSPLDSAKAIAMLAVNDVCEDEIFESKYENKALPTVLIPTTCGTGSEVTPYSILTNEKAKTKTSIACPAMFARFAFLDGRYLLNLPHSILLDTALDALSHNIEGFLSIRANKLSDILAREAIKIFSQNYLFLKDGNYTVENLNALLYASALGGMVISHTGTTAIHSMGYQLTYNKNIPHGRANAMLMPEFVAFAYDTLKNKIDIILDILSLDSCDDFKNYITPLLCSKYTFSEEELKMYSNISSKAKNIKNSVASPSEDEVFEIYKKSLL